MELLQADDELAEGGPLIGRHGPAVGHHGEQFVGAVDRLGESVAVAQVRRHLERIDLDVGLLG